MPSDPKFTPGPWIAKKGAGWLITRPAAQGDKQALEVGMTPKVSLVSSPVGDNDAEARANAYLMAAAPAMYEALADLMLFIRESEGLAGYHRNGEIATWSELEPEVQAAEAALAQARGEHDHDD